MDSYITLCEAITRSQTGEADVLSHEQRMKLVDLLGKRCRAATRARLKSILLYGLGTIYGSSILCRVHIYQDRVEYCAGQDYPGEIRVVRDIVLGR